MLGSSLIDLTGKVALVSGAAQGLGFACARQLAGAGASILLTDIRSDRLESARAALAGEGFAVVAEVGDVTSLADAERLVDAALSRLGSLDVLVNNAGVFSNVLVEHLPADEFRRIVDVNVTGAFLMTKAAAAVMRARGSGSIIMISSIDAIRPSGPGLLHYGTSKHALVGLTKSLSLELGPDGVRVNAICPGPSLTEGAREFVEAGSPDGIDTEAMWAAYPPLIPLRRLVEPDEIGRVAVFLASELASGVHGTTVVVDGGLVNVSGVGS